MCYSECSCMCKKPSLPAAATCIETQVCSQYAERCVAIVSDGYGDVGCAEWQKVCVKHTSECHKSIPDTHTSLPANPPAPRHISPAPTGPAKISSEIPIGCTSFSGGYRFYAAVTFPGLSSPLQLMIDSGSSTAAVCDHTLQNTIQPTPLNTVSCNLYGTPAIKEGYSGPFVKGNIQLGDQPLSDVTYAFMRYHTGMPCPQQGVGTLQGIFGVAFTGFDEGYQGYGFPTNGDYTSGSNWCNNAKESGQGSYYADPLMQHLTESTGSGSHSWGLYWNGVVGDNTGTMYLGASAKTNQHYTAGTPIVAGLFNAGDAGPNGRWGFYNIKLTGWIYCPTSNPDCSTRGHFSHINSEYGTREGFIQGMIDTGTPTVNVPSELFQIANPTDEIPFVVTIEDTNGNEAKIDLGYMKDLCPNQRVNCGIEEYQGRGPFVLGWPVWRNWYTVMDVDAKEMHWVRK